MGLFDRVKNALQHTTGEAKEAAGDITNDKSTKIDGKVDQAEATVNDKVEDVKDQLDD
jgi:uncharacterized protein YjbJ (UPF0337 family)